MYKRVTFTENENNPANNMKRNLFLIVFLLSVVQPISALQGITLKFNRTGTDASSVAITVADENGAAIENAKASFTSSHSLKATSNAVTGAVICPDVNANTSPAIELSFTLSGLPASFSFNRVGLDIHALNGASRYQENSDGVKRLWNVAATVNGGTFGSLADIDIAAGVGSAGAVHKVWEIENASAVECAGEVTITLAITKGSSNSGCFFGLSEVQLLPSDTGTVTPPEPDDDGAKVYYIQWKNTGGNYITETADNYLAVGGADVTKPQFWMFIPTGNENCYYIRNTATGRYMGSCNLTPSSASRITTVTTPVEYYVAKSAATSGEIAGCYYFSSTDCAGFSNENSGPRALNKDGASSYVITWQAGTSRTGSYWKLVETPDLFEVRPFEGSSSVGNIAASYNMVTVDGKNVSLLDGVITKSAPDNRDRNQEWYFVGEGNSKGWTIVSAATSSAVGIEDGKAVLGTQQAVAWKVNDSAVEGYYRFTSGGTTFAVDGDTLFRFERVRSALARKLKIYNNPCGAVGNNYVKEARIEGKGACGNIVYESSSKPSAWHVVYAMDKGTVAKGESFNLNITLASEAAGNLKAFAYFDWDGDALFETAVPVALAGTSGHAEINVPLWAAETMTRMRLRVSSNALELAEDEVLGFVYDFHISVTAATQDRTVSVKSNAPGRGTVELSAAAGSYPYGTELTATALPQGNARFVCWREEGVIVSTSAQYTFTVDRNVNLVACFSPNTQNSETSVKNTVCGGNATFLLQGNTITAYSDSRITGMLLYTADAAVVASSKGNTIDISGVAGGIYVVCAVTESGYVNRKIYLNK